MAEPRRAADERALRPGHGSELLRGGAAFFSCARGGDRRRPRRGPGRDLPLRVPAAPRCRRRRGARARGGARVHVRIVVDGIGTDPIPAEWQRRWQAAGVQWRVFNPASGWRVLLPQRWRRLHRKLCVVDGRVCFCGGINMIDDYVDPNYGKLEQPRFDFAVRATGPLVADAHETMTRLWLRLQVAREARHFDFAAALATVQRAADAGTDADDPQMSAGDLSTPAGTAADRACSPASCCATTSAFASASSTTTATRSPRREARS